MRECRRLLFDHRRSNFFRYDFAAESTASTNGKFNERTFMLGEKIGGISGKITSQRVLPHLGGGPKMETSFQATGSLLGTDLNRHCALRLIKEPTPKFRDSRSQICHC